MAAWNNEEWQYRILQRDVEIAYTELRYLWIAKQLGRFVKKHPPSKFDIPGIDKLPFDEALKKAADYNWGRIRMARKLIKGSGFPDFYQSTLELCP